MLRHRSALLSLEGLPDEATVAGPPAVRLDIATGLINAGIDHDELEGIECFSKTRWYVVFTTAPTRDRHLNTEISIGEIKFTLVHPNPPRQPSGPRLKHVQVFGYPLDSDPEVLRRAMSCYGDISHMTDLIDQRLKLKTGVRVIAFKSLTSEIPSFVYVGKHQVRCQYEGQTKTCRRCHQPGHIAKDCSAGDVCRECGQSGHKRNGCPNRKCYNCKQPGHLENKCPQYLDDYPEPQTADTENQQQENNTQEDTDTLQPQTDEWKVTDTSEWGDMPNEPSTAEPKPSTAKPKPSTAEPKPSTPTYANPDSAPETDTDSELAPTDDEELTLRGQKRMTAPSSSKKSKVKRTKRKTVVSSAKNRNPFLNFK